MPIGPRPSRSSHPRRCDFLPGKRKRRAAPARGGRAKREKQIEIETISSRHAVCLLDFFVCREKRKKRANASIDSFLVGEGGFARLRTGRSAALMRRRRIIHSRSPSNPPDKKRADASIDSFLVGEGGFEPPKSVTTDLQSAPFGRSGIPPYEIVELVDGFEPPTC